MFTGSEWLRVAWLLPWAAAGLMMLGCSAVDERGQPEASGETPMVEPPVEPPARGKPRLRTVYVPAYSDLPRGSGGVDNSLLSILLSIRNVDTSATVTLTHVDYFDTSGHRVRRYLRQPRKLRPLETAEFTVNTTDTAGGSGANFLVYWEGHADCHPLLTEAVMLGHMGGTYIVFTSRGVELDRRPDPASFDDESAPPQATD